ncbi:MAG: site-2 protease family protein [Clostridia bacterium]
MRIKLNVFFILFLFASYFAGWLQQALILFASVLLHELGHVFTAKKMRIQVYEVELLPYGGVARMEELSKFGGAAEAAVSAAGPVTSLAIAGACYLCRDFSGLMELGYRYNLIICIFNLLPVIPLDGGKLARNLLVFFMGYRQATRLLVLGGRAAAFILLGYDIYMLVSGSRSAALIIAAVFIYIGTIKEEKFSAYYYLFTGNSTKCTLIAQGHIRKRFIKVREDTQIRLVVNRFSPATLCYVQVANAKGEIKRILSEDEVMKGFLKYGYDGIISQIINI